MRGREGILNGTDLGFAAQNFDKLMEGNGGHYYVIVSVQRNGNSVTLMDAFRERNAKK